jgi:hypothetical protein
MGYFNFKFPFFFFLTNNELFEIVSQGHAISLLCRLYNQLKEEKYLISASKSLNIFDTDVEDGGVRSYLFFKSLNNTW